MNRPFLKLSCAVLFGVVAGFVIGRAPVWGGGAGAGNGRLQRTGAQTGVVRDQSGGLVSGRNGDGKAGAVPEGKRVELLADKFRRRIRPENDMSGDVDVIAEAASLSMEEFSPLIELLSKDKADRRVMRLLAIRWAMLDPAAALAFALDRPEIKGDQRLVSCLVQQLARRDLPAAKAALKELDHALRLRTGPAVALMILERDADAALAYARELEDSDAEVAVLKRMAENDPMAAAAKLTSGKENQMPVVEQISATLLKQDRTAFEAWYGNLQDPGQRAVARSLALRMDAESDPKGAAQAAAVWLAAEPEAAGRMRDGGLSESIVRRWMETKPAPSEVAAWAAGLPAGPLRDWAVTEMSRLWPDEDIMAASAWLASLPRSRGKDIGAQSLVERIMDESPAEAFEWARTLADPSMRYETLMNALSGWAEKDSAAAQAAVESLPAEDRGYLLKALQEQEKAKEQK